MDIQKEYIVQAALSELNQIRLAAGFEMIDEIPKGKRADSRCCPLTNAMKPIWTLVDTSPYWDTKEFSFKDIAKLPYGFSLPPHCYKFLVYFDNGQLSEYEELSK